MADICGRDRGEVFLRFDNIAGRYDFLNHLLSFGQDYYWRRVMAGELAPEEDDLVLDLATGTGDSSVAVVRKGVRVIGIDISPDMLRPARKKVPGDLYSPLLGSVYALPVGPETFSGAVCAFGIRNMHETGEALGEIYRVMKKGGRVVFLEFSMPEGVIRRPYGFYLRRVLPFIAGLFSNRDAYVYLGDSIQRFHRPDEFAKLIIGAGFSRCDMKRLSMGCVYIHKAYKD
jgi:demethylmenaquinone methyltransferase / 2-methoxy-6-polyprenyl-1,4-benzoquinol methylase